MLRLKNLGKLLNQGRTAFVKNHQWQKTKKFPQKSAFTIAEVSFVLLIMIVLTGAVLTSHKMIKTARFNRARALTDRSPLVGMDDLGVWFEATSRDSFTALKPSDGDAIALWKDINTHEVTKNNATSSGSNRPTYKISAINGLPALRFDGTDDYMDFITPFLANSSFTVFVVEARRAGQSGLAMFIGSNNSSLAFIMGYLNVNSIYVENQVSSGSNFTSFSSAVPNYSSPVPRIHSVVYNKSSGFSAYLNGTLLGTGGNSSALESQFCCAGARLANAAATWYYNGDIAEVAMVSRAVSDAERKEVENYLADKWGIAIN